MPDELTGQPAADDSPSAPPPTIGSPAPPTLASPTGVGESRPSASDPLGRLPRPPSWLRAALLSLVVLLAGAALGAAGFRLEHAHTLRPPQVTRSADGWRVTAQAGRELHGLALSGTSLIWGDGGAIEFMDTDDGDVLPLGPGPGGSATWEPALGERYALWFEAERPQSLAAHAVAYDTQTGRRWTVAEVGSVQSYPAMSGDVAVWCSAPALGEPAINGVRIAGGDAFMVAKATGAPVISGGLVVWAHGWYGPFTAAELASGRSWPVTSQPTNGKVTGMSLSGRTFVWGESGAADGSGAVVAVDVDGDGQTVYASGLSGLAGPAYDGRTVVWAERLDSGYRVMARRPGGDAFVVASADGAVKEVAVSGDSAAWVETAHGAYTMVVTRLPR